MPALSRHLKANILLVTSLPCSSLPTIANMALTVLKALLEVFKSTSFNTNHFPLDVQVETCLSLAALWKDFGELFDLVLTECNS